MSIHPALVRALAEMRALYSDLWEMQREHERCAESYREDGDAVLAFKSASEAAGIAEARRAVGRLIGLMEVEQMDADIVRRLREDLPGALPLERGPQ